MGIVLVDELAEVRLRGFALSFDRLAKASSFVFNAKSSNFISEVSFSYIDVLLVVAQVRDQLIHGWICWESPLPPATSEANPFIQKSLKEIFGGSRGVVHTFSYMISSVSISVRSCLIELQSFLQSKVDVDPKHRVLIYSSILFACIVPRMTRCFQVNYLRISVFFVHRIHRREEYRVSFAQILSSRYQS